MDDDKKSEGDSPFSGLGRLLDVRQIGENHYQGRRNGTPTGTGRVFGGQVIAQALMAATKTVASDRFVHSLHAYFLRAGDESQSIHFKVERDTDGRSFSNRRIVATQNDRPILTMIASFNVPEVGLSHQIKMPDVPMPEDVEEEHVQMERAVAAMPGKLPKQLQRLSRRMRPFETRPVTFHPLVDQPKPAFQQTWFRIKEPLGDDQSMHRTVLAFMSDMRLLGTSLLPHGKSVFTHKMQWGSLDHAVWIHEDINVNDWLFYSTESPRSHGARGMNRGSIFTRDGRLVATTNQESLMRELT